MTQEHQPNPDFFAIVELMGHQRTAGHVLATEFGNGELFRLDVPPHNGQPAFTNFYNYKAVYRIVTVDEATVLAALNNIRPKPYDTYLLPQFNEARQSQESGEDNHEDDYHRYGEDDEEDDYHRYGEDDTPN